MPTLAFCNFDELQKTVQSLVEWDDKWKPANGCLVVLTLVGSGDSVIKVQVRRVQGSYAVIRKMTIRLPLSGEKWAAGYWHEDKWTYAVHAHTKPGNLCQRLAPTDEIPAHALSPALKMLRNMVGDHFASEGRFLDWLAYRCDLEINVTALDELTTEQALSVMHRLVSEEEGQA